MAGRSTESLGVMPIDYEWVCKFCGRPNAAGTDRCAFCRNPAIARPIDIDPRYEKVRLDDEERRKKLAALPPLLRGIVVVLLSIFIVGAVIARLAWTIGAGLLGIGLMVVTGIPALVISKWGSPETSERPKHDA